MTAQLAGMGAIPFDQGVAFRVWAPNAQAVTVKGDFNGWSEDANPLTDEGNGYWYGVVDGARAGQEYKYHLRNGDDWFDRNDPYARRVTNSVGNSVVVDHSAYDWQGDSFACPPHNELVIYELHVGSFNSPGDGALGNFDSVLQRLDHIIDLGFNAVQLMPVMEFAGDRSWGYNPAHPFTVESAYGGPDGLKDFIRECHRRGLAVLVDVVYNHFGPSDLDLWRFDGWGENDKGGIYFYNDWRSSTPWGDTRPDYGRGEVRQYIHDNAMMWLEDYHADGLRYDMTVYIRTAKGGFDDIPEGWSLMTWINQDIRAKFPGKILIAEDMHSNPDLVGAEEGQAAFHSQWDAGFVHPLRAAMGAFQDSDRSMADIAGAIGHIYDAEAFRRVIYTESHDEVANGKARSVTDINPHDQQGWHAQKRTTLGAAVTLTSPGIPMLFQGQEFMQGGFFSDDRPLDWTLNDTYPGIVALHRDLIRLRRNWTDETRGLSGQGFNVFHTNDDFKVIAWHRWKEHGTGDDVVVVMNWSGEMRGGYRIGLPAGGTWKLQLNSDAKLYSDSFGVGQAFDLVAEDDDQDGYAYSAAVDLAPYSVLVYSWQG
ncbi:alpha-amylase family glycosyl hydrolase [Luteococcus sanguinis]|uniref:1,4-alpha-glucan branching enzyme n=1 Tax=Luteococcus sanguinis TaxID=174038 RepID=A0ABW1WYZ3_9ACTN